jgi:hypothetical protein
MHSMETPNRTVRLVVRLSATEHAEFSRLASVRHRERPGLMGATIVRCWIATEQAAEAAEQKAA